MIVCVGVSGWFVMQLSKNIVTRKICDGDRNFAGRIAQEIEADVVSVKPTLTLLAQTPELRLMEATKVAVGVDRIQRAFPEITSVYVADMGGKQVYRTGTGPLKNVSSMRSFQVAKGKEEFSSDIYLKPTTLEPMQTITLPIINSETVVGVLSADVSFGRMMRSFMGVGVGEDGNVIVVAGDGRVIAHTHIEQVQGVDLSRLPVVKAVLAGEAGTMMGYTDELGREVLGTYMPISELGWGVLIQRPIANMYAEVGQLRTAIIWVLIAIVLLILPAGWLMSRQIARPIGQIAGASKRVAQGDLSTSVDIKSSNEVGLLAHSFNQMVMSLKKAKEEHQQWGEAIEQSRNALRESEEKMRIIIESSPIGIRIARQGRYAYVNNSFLQMFGYDSLDELSGLPIETLYIPEQRPLVKKRQQDRLSGKAMSPVLERKGLKKNGQIFEVSVWQTKIDFKGEPATLAFLINVSEERALRRRLEQAQKMEAIGTLAGGIAHDFNNILSAIIGYSELAQMKLEADSEIKNDIKEVLTAGVRAKNLVKQILAFSRQTQEEQMPIQMGLIAKEVLKLLRSSLPTTIDIRQSIQSQSVILSDPTQLHQIVMNLCANAAHAMREKGGTLEIALTDVELDSDFASTHPEIQPGDYQKLMVSDTGHGMTPEVMSRIFDPFFTTKPVDEGTGLGLSVVHGIVKDCGGTITVYSEPGKGTTFNLYFPIIKDKAEEKPGEYKIIPTGTERILVVDDEKAIIDISKKILTSLGYAVEVRTSSIEALELLKAMPDKFDLIITDMTMPQMTGDKLAMELMKVRPDIPVILCTGFNEKITKERAEAMGIKAFLMKPLLKEEMAHKIRKVLDREIS